MLSSKHKKGWLEEDSLYDYLKDRWEIEFKYNGQTYYIYSIDVDGYTLEQYDPSINRLAVLHHEKTVDDFMARGFMGKPIQPIIDESIIMDIH